MRENDKSRNGDGLLNNQRVHVGLSSNNTSTYSLRQKVLGDKKPTSKESVCLSKERSLFASTLSCTNSSINSHTFYPIIINRLVTMEMDTQRRKFKKICVFCGSRRGHKSSFGDAARKLGKQLVEKNIDLVYGGGNLGLMGLVSRTVFDGGCHVLGIIPKALLADEICGGSIGELRIVADMHQRKAEMYKNADAFIALPGGYGTMEELLEIVAWSQLGIHEKPVGLLNVDGYFNSLLALFDKGVEEGFIEDSARHIVISANSAEQLINKLEEYAPLHEIVAPMQSWEVDQSHTSTSGEGPAP